MHLLGTLICLGIAVTFIKCAPTGLDIDEDGIETAYDASDIDSVQLRGRYDARLLSENISGLQSVQEPSMKAASDEEATSCRNVNAKYVHGQKVPRSDPCEVCLCVDGEIFCWWKKCDHLLEKFAYLLKHRRKIPTNVQRKRKKHFFVNRTNRHQDLLNRSHHDAGEFEHVDMVDNDKMFSDDDRDTGEDINATIGKENSDNAKRITKQKEAQLRSNSDVFPNLEIQNRNGFEHEDNGQRSAIASSSAAMMLIEKSPQTQSAINLFPNERNTQTTNNDQPQQEASALVHITADLPIERGYYEKTIFNKNGVFIENIRKISSLDNHDQDASKRQTLAADEVEGVDDNGVVHHKVILNAESAHKNADGGIIADVGETVVDLDVEARERKKIRLMSVPLSEHYVITSSGRIAKSADALASDDVITQFREGLACGNEYQQQQHQATTTTDRDPTHDAEFSQISTVAKDTEPISMAAAQDALEPSTRTKDTTTMQSTVPNYGTENNIQPMCIVMGKSYPIAAVLPQETGNCLQCVCAAGTLDDVSPRVTCSSHNCPPLILPDLFDATGY